MSDLFSRLAERAIRETQPPPPTGFTVVDEYFVRPEPASKPTATERAPVSEHLGAPPQALVRGRHPADSATVAAATAPEPGAPRQVARAPAEPAAPLPGEPPPAQPESATIVIAPTTRQTTPTPSSSAVPDDAPPALAMPAPTPAAAITVAQPIPAEPAWPAATVAPEPRPSDDEPAVHVHIGRLDVRANLEQPTPPDRPQRSARPEPALSLSAYLRGERTGS